jgi:hypothetical protein
MIYSNPSSHAQRKIDGLLRDRWKGAKAVPAVVIIFCDNSPFTPADIVTNPFTIKGIPIAMA